MLSFQELCSQCQEMDGPQPPQEAPSVQWTESGPVYTCRTPDCVSCDAERELSPSSSASSFAERAQTLADAYAADRHQYGPAEARASLARDVVALAQQVRNETLEEAANLMQRREVSSRIEDLIGHAAALRSLVSQSPEKEGRR